MVTELVEMSNLLRSLPELIEEVLNKKNWSVSEYKRRKVCVETFSRLAIIPSKISVNKPTEKRIIAISL